MTDMQKIEEYLKKSGIFYLATVNGTQPRIRPVSIVILKDEVLYFGVGTFKEVYQQLRENPYVEICACQGGNWLRCYGKAVFEQNDTIANIALNTYPQLQNIYNEKTGHTLGMFRLEDATVEFRGILDIKEKFTF